jgi:hypothetical protein
LPLLFLDIDILTVPSTEPIVLSFMSFYFDDDDDDQNKVKNDDSFMCDNCNGTESYMDETTGVLTCTECFTQSQTIVAASQMEMDVEDALGLAGRSRGGQLIERVGTRNKSGRGPGRPGKTFEECDKSEKLPDTLQCIQGIQRILKVSTKIVCNLMGGKNNYASVLTTVKAMWQAYLLSWQEGADYYSPLYPEVRFSFRDQFLNNFQKSHLAKTLSYMAAKRLEEKIKEEEKEKYKDEDEDEDENDTENNRHEDILVPEDEDDSSECSALSAEVVPKPKSDAGKTALTRMIHHHLKQTCTSSSCWVGRKEGAVMLEPGMLMVSCILLVATSPLGLTTNHFRRWIANGSLPLLNAFSLLKPTEQESLKNIKPIFRMEFVPSVTSFDKMVTKLHIACGYKPRPILVRRKGKAPMKTKASKSYRPGHTILPSHVPMLAARFVSDLGLNQQVLNYTLSILGQAITTEISHGEGRKKYKTQGRTEERLWLPPRLKKARLDLLLDNARILAVIVIACKMIPGWDNLIFQVPVASDQSNDRMNDTANTSDRDTCKTHFVPRTAGHFRFLKNGPIMDNYLDFVEGTVLTRNELVMPEFLKSLELPKNSDQQQQSTKSTVRPNDTFLSHKKGLTRKIRNEGTFHYQMTEKVPKGGSFAWQLSPPLGPLLEYIGYKTATNPMEILDYVAELDVEVAHMSDKHHGRI